MTWLQVFFLSIVQGLTEFLPISSSGHLAIFQNIFKISETPIVFDVLVHLGTLISIILILRKDILQKTVGLFKKEKESLNLLKLILIGTIPAIIVGLLLNNFIENAFNSFKLLGITFLITSAFLFSTKFIKRQNKSLSQLKGFDALFVGIFQAIAILPGVSRSGSTMVSSLWRGASGEAAFYLSFYLAIPAILGAVVLKIKDIVSLSNEALLQGIVGLIISATVGYFALILVKNLLKNAQLFWFGFYCLILGIVLLII